MHNIGKIKIDVLITEFGVLKSENVILTDERKRHIKERHYDDYNLFIKYARNILENPDAILKDRKHENTIFVLKYDISIEIILLQLKYDTFNKKLHFIKAYTSIVEIDEGIDISFNEEHPENAKDFI